MELDDSYYIDDDTVCTICQAEFLDIDDLQRHVKQYHLNKSNLSRFCPFCMEIMIDLEILALHMRDKHFRSIQCCKYCTRVFIDADLLSKHAKKHRHSELYPKISCSHCINIFDTKNDLELHEFKEHRHRDDSVMLQDAFSTLSSVLNMNIRSFFQSTQDNLLFVCAICKMSTLNVNAYIKHIKKENKTGYVCDVCYNVYDTKTKISKHCVKHRFPLPIRKRSVQQQCERCNKSFTATNLTKHLKKCMDMQCNSCSLTFNSVTEFSMHMANHSHEKTVPLHICKYCQRPWVGVDTLEKHIERQHKHEMHLYKYHCKYCDKIFKHPKRLFGHFFTQHKDLQPYICKICNKNFRIRRNFTLHIKLDHKSVGFVEFDGQFHVYFTDRRTLKSKENVAEISEIDNNISGILKEDVRKPDEKEIDATVEETITLNEYFDDVTEIDLTDTDTKENENIQVSGENIENVDIIDKEVTSNDINKKNKKLNLLELVSDSQANKETTQVEQSNRKSEMDYESEFSSDNSDMPLLKVIKKKTLINRKRKRKIQRSQQNKLSAIKNFICKKCDRNCYTYQNYHRHLALHMKNECKICVKCYGKFRSEAELKRHIEREHSSSKLTETLKKLLERKKNLESSDKSLDSYQTEPETERKIPISERFKRTIKKVNIEKTQTSVTITPIERDKLSAKKFIENFMPENQEISSKITIFNSLSIKPVICDKKESFIKLTKFTREPETNARPKLRKPVKFKDDEEKEEYNVTIKVVDKPLRSSGFSLLPADIIETEDSCYEVQEVEAPTNNTIPEVGREVMLDGIVDNPSPMQRTIIINDRLATDNIRIGHLWPQAPFFKIVKINEVIKDKIEDPVQEKEPNITLPNGTKLVNVNPLSHLLGNRSIDEVNKAKSKYCYYKPKVRNIGEALAKALTGLEKTPYVRKRANILRKKKS